MKKPDDQAFFRERYETLQKLVSRCGFTYQPLQSDLTYAIKQWQQDKGSQFWSRTAIRCLCAVIEACLFGFRKMAEEMASVSKVQFEPEEAEILAGVRIKNGIQRPKWLSPTDSVKESFRLFGKSVGCTVAVDYGDAGFAALAEVFKIRNRLMHPKMPFDVEVRESDLQTADKAIKWFNGAFVGVIDQSNAHVAKTVVNKGKRS